ncbi:MAG: PDZ domain-containing protein, partial [bacterium]|nr:PDZ domain-containing protein [bacterium]
EAGAKLEHVGYDTATHNDAYLLLEIPRVAKLISKGKRNPYQKQLYWECSDVKWGRIDWLQITELDTLAPKADWHKEYNLKLKDTRVSIGFIPVQDTSQMGVTVASIVDDSTSAAVTAGLQKNDRIVQLDSFEITDYSSFLKARSTKQRGDSITLGVIRNSKRLTLRGKIPPIQEYDALPRRFKSGAVIAKIVENQVHLETSRVKKITLYLNQNLMDTTKPIQIYWNQTLLYHDKLPPLINTRLPEPFSHTWTDAAYPIYHPLTLEIK